MNGTVSLLTGDGIALEARWDLPPAPRLAVVFCHPHPQYGGTMRGPLMHKVTKAMVGAGLAVLRFNFRGVGRSEGTWSGGEAAVNDVAAAVATSGETYPDLPQGVMGWSFGAATSLRWQAREGDARPYVGIAPPVASPLSGPLPDSAALAPAPRRFIIGDRDQFTGVDALQEYAGSIGAEVEVLAGSDHFFYFREDQVGALAVDALVEGAGRSDSQ